MGIHIKGTARFTQAWASRLMPAFQGASPETDRGGPNTRGGSAMSQENRATTDELRTMLARRGLVFPEADLAAGVAQLEAIRQALEELNQFDIAVLEPSTYVSFDDRR